MADHHGVNVGDAFQHLGGECFELSVGAVLMVLVDEVVQGAGRVVYQLNVCFAGAYEEALRNEVVFAEKEIGICFCGGGGEIEIGAGGLKRVKDGAFADDAAYDLDGCDCASFEGD